MALPSRHQGDLFVAGNLQAQSMTIPAGSVGDDQVPAGAGIAATKVVHQFPLRYSQADGSDVAAATVLIHTVYGSTASIVAIETVVATAATGDAEATVDLQKGNASTAFATVLNSAITIDSSIAARTPAAGTVSSASLADGDTLQVVVTAAAGTGTLPQGLVVTVTLQEDPQ